MFIISSHGCLLAILSIPVQLGIILGIGLWSSKNYLLGVPITCLFVWLLVLMFKERNKEKKKVIKEIEDKYAVDKSLRDMAMVKWNRLYYCHRDGIVFDPETGKTSEPTHIQELIND
jgi:hypothetical protein